MGLPWVEAYTALVVSEDTVAIRQVSSGHGFDIRTATWMRGLENRGLKLFRENEALGNSRVVVLVNT